MLMSDNPFAPLNRSSEPSSLFKTMMPLGVAQNTSLFDPATEIPLFSGK
jgi:hypothetical protein